MTRVGDLPDLEESPAASRPPFEVRFPVIEVFGPTIQGEGPDAGRPCDFIRFGGCDYRCSWCDSLYAVEPELVREHAEKLTSAEIERRLVDLGSPARMVVLSGGNPALFGSLGSLVKALHLSGRRVAVETQGSVWRDWLATVDVLVISPKPPSSGMASPEHAEQTRRFLREASSPAIVACGQRKALKVVVFDVADYWWAQELHAEYPGFPFYVSAGTPQRLRESRTVAQVLERFRWLAKLVAGDEAMRDVVVLPQLHVLAFGTGRGV